MLCRPDGGAVTVKRMQLGFADAKMTRGRACDGMGLTADVFESSELARYGDFVDNPTRFDNEHVFVRLLQGLTSV